MAVRLIALDIDGTLLDSRWQLPEANRAAIAEATRRGIEVALVTGRRYDFAMPVARKLDFPLTMIVNNGALIRSDDGRTHLRHLLPQGIALQVLELTRPWREGAAVIFDRPLENQLMLEGLDPGDSMRYAYYSRNKEFIGIANPLETCLTEDPIQLMLAGKVGPMRDAEAALRAATFAEDFALAMTSYESKDFAMIDVINPVCSKGSSLAEWAALRGFAREEVMAIGDNHNDLEMLSFAGIPVVMGNSVPALKTYGWHETGTNDENGVASAIEHFALREAAAIEPEDVFTPLPAAATPAAVQPLYRDLVEAAAKRYNVDADLITSVIAVESNFDPKAVSRKNARGLMQLLPETAAQLGVRNIDDPAENIDAGTRYLRDLLQKYINVVALALAAYNAGPDKVQLYGRVPPYAETISYVRRVKRGYEKNKSAPSAKT